MAHEKSVFISAGHSTSDPGAVYFGRKESEIVSDFRNMVAFYLRRAGIKFEADGTGNENKPLAYAIARAREHVLAIEFHCNAAANPAATGVEVLCNKKDAEFSSLLSIDIASALGLRNRGAKPENAGQHSRLGFIRAGGIIVELFFLSNAVDLAAYDARKLLAAKAVANCIIWNFL